MVLKELDPAGVSMRRARRLRWRNYFAKGPNFIWHLDSYDMLISVNQDTSVTVAQW